MHDTFISVQSVGFFASVVVVALIAPLSWTFLLLALPYRVESSDIMRAKNGAKFGIPTF
jgi:hypothetical protein